LQIAVSVLFSCQQFVLYLMLGTWLTDVLCHLHFCDFSELLATFMCYLCERSQSCRHSTITFSFTVRAGSNTLFYAWCCDVFWVSKWFELFGSLNVLNISYARRVSRKSTHLWDRNCGNFRYVLYERPQSWRHPTVIFNFTVWAAV